MGVKPQFPEEQAKTGGFVRQEDPFRHWVRKDGSSPYAAAPGRYHLYVSLACPWASRSLIARNLLGLHEAVGVTVADPVRDEKGWAFREGPGHTVDPVNGFKFLSQAYHATDQHFHGRVTVPVLWDKETSQIVNNSEDDICRMFNDEFREFGKEGVDLFPKEIEQEHAELAEFIYDRINNGVYKAGFASSQAAYEKPCRELFAALDEMDERLSAQRYLFGKRIVEADWRLFCTLVRFDAVYYGHFKCNLRRIADYPNLQPYLQDLYQQPGIADSVNLDHIKRHYYMTHEEINPTRIVPLGPELNLNGAHGRERLT